MNIELDIHGLRRLVRGSVPHVSVLTHPLVKRVIWFYKGDKSIKLWSHAELNQLTETELWNLYCICRDSWPKVEGSWDIEGRALSVYYDHPKI